MDWDAVNPLFADFRETFLILKIGFRELSDFMAWEKINNVENKIVCWLILEISGNQTK